MYSKFFLLYKYLISVKDINTTCGVLHATSAKVVVDIVVNPCYNLVNSCCSTKIEVIAVAELYTGSLSVNLLVVYRNVGQYQICFVCIVLKSATRK